MVNDIWTISSNTPKSVDKMVSGIPDSNEYLSLKELCEKLSISTATGRNWIRLGKLSPEYTKKNTPYFSKNYAEALRIKLESATNKALKSRRNKKFVSGNSLYNSYVSEQCKNIPALQKLLALASYCKIDLCMTTIQILVADCALHLFISKNKIQINEHNNLLLQFLLKGLSIGEYDSLVSDLIEDTSFAISFCKKYPLLFDMEYIYETNEDILGLIYISCKNIGNRKATGSYYTSTKVVKTLIKKFNFQKSQKILDPCCGTGNFLLQLPEQITFDSVYGNDIDTASVKITRLNMALKYAVPITEIYEHITDLDYLTDYANTDFQYIIGNPPWGYEFSEEEKSKLRNIYKSTSGKNIESYNVFIEQALNHLASDGRLAYILPEAILNVKAHKVIRKIILEKCSIKNLDYLGNAFDEVQCPSIILDLQFTHSAPSTLGINVNTGNESFTINTERRVTPERFSFAITDSEYKILNKLRKVPNTYYLLGNADFALGIVTGNNEKFISDKKTDSNEIVLKGANIRKFHIKHATSYIIFKPESLQQIAPIEMYRAQEKLLYRFIGRQLVFAYDDKQRLSLNSCNIVIPKIPGLKIKYVLAILNSRIAQFIYKREFNSIKVLRSHIENIPIPKVDEPAQDSIIALTEKLISGLEKLEAIKVYDELDFLISQIFNLNSEEFEIIKKAVDGENKFLV